MKTILIRKVMGETLREHRMAAGMTLLALQLLVQTFSHFAASKEVA